MCLVPISAMMSGDFLTWFTLAIFVAAVSTMDGSRPWKTYSAKNWTTWVWFILVLPVLMPSWIVMKLVDGATWCDRGLIALAKRINQRFTPPPPIVLPGTEQMPPAAGEFTAPGATIEFNPGDSPENLPEITWDDADPSAPPVSMKQAYCDAMLRDPEIAWEGELMDTDRSLNEIAGKLQNLEEKLMAAHANQADLKRKKAALISAGKPAPYPEGHRAQLEHDFDCLMSLRNVSAVRVVDNTLKVWVPGVTVQVEGKTYDLGDYEILVHLLSRKITVACLRVINGRESWPHPYTYGESICVGNRRERMAEFLQARNFAPAVGLLVEAMHHVNPGDEGKVTQYYPALEVKS
jgi:hypothetical protein